MEFKNAIVCTHCILFDIFASEDVFIGQYHCWNINKQTNKKTERPSNLNWKWRKKKKLSKRKYLEVKCVAVRQCQHKHTPNKKQQCEQKIYVYFYIQIKIESQPKPKIKTKQKNWVEKYKRCFVRVTGWVIVCYAICLRCDVTWIEITIFISKCKTETMLWLRWFEL